LSGGDRVIYWTRPILLADVADEFDDLFITDIKSDAADKVTP